MTPEDSRRKFEAAMADLRAAFAEWAAAKEEQIEQLLDLGRSGKHEEIKLFLEHLEQQTKRLYAEAQQTRDDATSMAGAAESVQVEERLQAMKVLWNKLRAEGVPIDQRPLDGNLSWWIQFQAQAESDPTGKDMEWWKAHKDNFSDLL